MGRKFTSGIRILLQFLAAAALIVFWFQAHFNWNYVAFETADAVIFGFAVALYAVAWIVEVLTWCTFSNTTKIEYPVESQTTCCGWLKAKQNVQAMHYGGLVLMLIALEEVSLKDGNKADGDLFRAFLYVGIVLIEIGVFTWGIDKVEHAMERVPLQDPDEEDVGEDKKVKPRVITAQYTL